MAKLIYVAITSVDGYVADETGNFDWAAPDEETHLLVNDLVRPAGTQLYGRRMYEVLVAWEDPSIAEGQPECIRDFHEIWMAADKVVYSRTLHEPSSARTRIEHNFDPDAIREMKRTAQRDISIGGPELAALAFGAGLVDECHLVVVPHLAGGGNRALRDGAQRKLALLAERRLSSGAVHLGYRVQAA
jgi:dihydrofolate reductase